MTAINFFIFLSISQEFYRIGQTFLFVVGDPSSLLPGVEALLPHHTPFSNYLFVLKYGADPAALTEALLENTWQEKKYNSNFCVQERLENYYNVPNDSLEMLERVVCLQERTPF